MASEDDRHDFVRKIQSDAFRVVEMTRAQAKKVYGLHCDDDNLDETFGNAIDEAEAEANQDGLTAIVIIKIVGASL